MERYTEYIFIISRLIRNKLENNVQHTLNCVIVVKTVIAKHAQESVFLAFMLLQPVHINLE